MLGEQKKLVYKRLMVQGVDPIVKKILLVKTCANFTSSLNLWAEK